MSDAPPWRFVKGHGTGNDFVILPDPDGLLDIPPVLVRALCDRRAGIGGDGLLRVVRAARFPEGIGLDVEWFMDYRNADGSVSQMCGNGVRVFARYLVDAGLALPGTLRVATRAGVKAVVVPAGGGDIVVDMGPPRPDGEAVVEFAGRPLGGVIVSMGNPHLVCGTSVPVSELDLAVPPRFDPNTFPEGVNVEVVNLVGGGASEAEPPEGADLHVRMRVHERGIGETASCGTGACAVAAVVLRSAGWQSGRVAVDVPGGRLTVTVTETTSLLAGPAVLVAGGELSPAWLADAQTRAAATAAVGSPA